MLRDEPSDVARINPVCRVVIGAGRRRRVFPLANTAAEQRAMAVDVNRALFGTAGRMHKARRRGERALAGHTAPVAESRA